MYIKVSQTQYDSKVKFFDVMNDCLMERQPGVPKEQSRSLLPEDTFQTFAINKPVQQWL